MTELLFLAVEEAIPADHPASLLAIPLGLLFLSGSVYLLLRSNYGARKAAAIYGVAFFGFSFLIGVFWWFGGPGIPPGLGVSHLPGESASDYQEAWYPFEEGSERAAFFEGIADLDAFESLEAYSGLEGADFEELEADPAYGSLSGSVGSAVQDMQDLFLPVDDNNVAQIGAERRAGFEEEAAEARPDEAVFRAAPFYSAQPEGDPFVREDPGTGLLLVAQEFQAYATFTDEEQVPLDPIPVGEPQVIFAFQDPGMVWYPSAIWTIVSVVLFGLSLLWLDTIEQREKRLRETEVEEPERIAQPIAQ